MANVTRLLVANRGEIARRVQRTAREMGITTIAVYSDPDAAMAFVREADVAIALGGSAVADTYLDISKVIDAAARSGADAVHPGYGFLSENADFARACGEAGLTFIGPSPEAIEQMGAKVAAKKIAESAGVPTLPYREVPGAGDSDINAGELGLPVLVKAVAGGGGRGMRIVEDAAELATASESASREALSAFGDGTVFLERYLPNPRHVEIQILADTHGNVVHLGERECSIQRNHQKIIEEAPSPAVDDELRAAMGAAAVALAEAIGYTGAGTVEFVLDTSGHGDDFYFLEMNTRLQVEHPVTEAVTGRDLVRAQIAIAQGEPLGFGQGDVGIDGHAIEARLYAEDPAQGWMPGFGPLHDFSLPASATSGIRLDSGFGAGDEISTFYDPMLAKVITHAPSRGEAAARLARGLREFRIHGPVTNRDYLAAVLEDPDFLAGATTTGFCEAHPDLLTAGPDPVIVVVHALAATLVAAHRRRCAAPVLGFAPSGWRNVPSKAQRSELCRGDDVFEIDYDLDGRFCRATVNGGEHHCRVVECGTGSIELEVDGVTHACAVNLVSGAGTDTYFVNTPLAQSRFDEVPRFAGHESAAAAGGPTAPVPGTVVSVEVAAGDRVGNGDTLVVLEAMKMEHRICAAADAVVADVLVAAGDNVDAHQLLVELEQA